jgi:DNA-directed RNA polymerase omega subunit
LDTYGKIDSKFRFVILASKRAKQLIRGAKAKIRSKSKNPIRIAQVETKEGLVDYEILKSSRQDIIDTEEQVIIADEVVEDVEDAAAGAAGDEDLGETEEASEEGSGDYEEELPAEDVGEGKDDE